MKICLLKRRFKTDFDEETTFYIQCNVLIYHYLHNDMMFCNITQNPIVVCDDMQRI